MQHTQVQEFNIFVAAVDPEVRQIMRQMGDAQRLIIQAEAEEAVWVRDRPGRYRHWHRRSSTHTHSQIAWSPMDGRDFPPSRRSMVAHGAHLHPVVEFIVSETNEELDHYLVHATAKITA